ncbi:hypothetical protein FQZ97_536840 [compost metagenome]
MRVLIYHPSLVSRYESPIPIDKQIKIYTLESKALVQIVIPPLTRAIDRKRLRLTPKYKTFFSQRSCISYSEAMRPE